MTSTAGKHYSAKQRARVLRELKRDVRRNPTVALTKSFAKKADLVDFKLPMTVRLATSNGNGGYNSSDDSLELTWDDSAILWPLAGGATPAPETVTLDGRFTMEASYGGDAAGYGEPGAMETVQGGGIAMTASPFTISDFAPACATGPQLATRAGTPVAITSAASRYGVLNMFSGHIQGSLALRMTFAAEVADACGGTAATTPTVDNSGAAQMPVHFDGTFSVSPAITADGKFRFGKITVDDAVTPQTSTFAYVRSCTGTTSCDPQQFPARLKLKKLTAEVLLGDIH